MCSADMLERRVKLIASGKDMKLFALARSVAHHVTMSTTQTL